MFEKDHEGKGKPKNAKSKKSTVKYTDFESRLKDLQCKTSDFISFSGIARSTINGWSKIDEGVPLYALRILELFEIRMKVNTLYEISRKDGTVKTTKIPSRTGKRVDSRSKPASKTKRT